MSTANLNLAQRTAHEGAAPSIPQHFRRSWADALIALVERLPGPAAATYVAVTIIASACGLGLLVATGSLPEGSYRLQVPVKIVLAIGGLALIRYLNAVASERLDQVAPVLAVDAASLDRVRYELTNMPARGAIIATILGVGLISLAYQADVAAADFAKLPVLAQVVGAISDAAGLAMMSVLGYHTIRQLRVVDRIHRMAGNVDLFNVAPLHAFAGLTARTGVGLIIGATALLVYPDASTYISTWVVFTILMASGVAVFVLPLLGMQRRLAAEKGRLVGAADQRLKATLERLDRQVDGWDLTGADGLNKTLASQLLQRDVLARLPTWPWSTATFRGFVSVLIVPIMVWLIQRVLANVI